MYVQFLIFSAIAIVHPLQKGLVKKNLFKIAQKQFRRRPNRYGPTKTFLVDQSRVTLFLD
jgi:hypothetical protein